MDSSYHPFHERKQRMKDKKIEFHLYKIFLINITYMRQESLHLMSPYSQIKLGFLNTIISLQSDSERWNLTFDELFFKRLGYTIMAHRKKDSNFDFVIVYMVACTMGDRENLSWF